MFETVFDIALIHSILSIVVPISGVARICRVVGRRPNDLLYIIFCDALFFFFIEQRCGSIFSFLKQFLKVILCLFIKKCENVGFTSERYVYFKKPNIITGQICVGQCFLVPVAPFLLVLVVVRVSLLYSLLRLELASCFCVYPIGLMRKCSSCVIVSKPATYHTRREPDHISFSQILGSVVFRRS